MFLFKRTYVIDNLKNNYSDLFFGGQCQMKRSIYSVLICLLFVVSVVQVGGYPVHINSEISTSTQGLDPAVYPPSPDWISANPHYSTGGAMADFNHDGWLDLVVADGNDIQQGHLNVFYNDGSGGFCTSCGWQSTDVAYNGHLDVADVNGDGWMDVAVAHLGTGSTLAPIVRVYLNNEGTLSSLPDWEADINGNAFGCAFGDVNNDGRPDLAVATGWSYSPQNHYKNYVYKNVNGVLEASASWMSSDMNDYQGALWVDADYDGWLDLVYIGNDAETSIYRNLGGVLETTASWQSSDSALQDGLMLAVGDITGDGYRELYTADNVQLGNGYFKQYTGLSSGFFTTTSTWSYYDGYCSAVAVADVDGDSLPDLATGGWWDNTRIFLNQGTSLPTSPSWSSGLTSVVEKIVFGNIGPTRSERTRTETFTGDGSQQLFYLPYQNIQYIESVKMDGTLLDYDEFMYNREYGWIITSSPPITELVVVYNQSRSLDMVVTNWDSSKGNYLYYNRVQDNDLDVTGSVEWTGVKPGETVYGSFNVKNIGDPTSELDWEIISIPSWGTWTVLPMSGIDLTPEDGPLGISIEVTAPNSGGPLFEGEIVVVNSKDSDDIALIPVLLDFSNTSDPEFHIDSVSGKVGVTVEFSNIGDSSASDVEYSLSVSGGLLNLIDKNVTDNLTTMDPGQSVAVKSGLILGLGRITVQFSVSCAEGASEDISIDGNQLIIFTILD